MKQSSIYFAVSLLALVVGCSAGSDTIVNTPNNSGGGEDLGMSLATIYTGSHYDGIYYSTNVGYSWTLATSSPAGAYSLASNGHYLFAAVAHEFGQGGVYRSSDFGHSWSRLANSPDTIVWSV